MVAQPLTTACRSQSSSIEGCSVLERERETEEGSGGGKGQKKALTFGGERTDRERERLGWKEKETILFIERKRGVRDFSEMKRNQC